MSSFTNWNGPDCGGASLPQIGTLESLLTTISTLTSTLALYKSDLDAHVKLTQATNNVHNTNTDTAAAISAGAFATVAALNDEVKANGNRATAISTAITNVIGDAHGMQTIKAETVARTKADDDLATAIKALYNNSGQTPTGIIVDLTTKLQVLITNFATSISTSTLKVDTILEKTAAHAVVIGNTIKALDVYCKLYAKHYIDFQNMAFIPAQAAPIANPPSTAANSNNTVLLLGILSDEWLADTTDTPPAALDQRYKPATVYIKFTDTRPWTAKVDLAVTKQQIGGPTGPWTYDGSVSGIVAKASNRPRLVFGLYHATTAVTGGKEHIYLGVITDDTPKLTWGDTIASLTNQKYYVSGINFIPLNAQNQANSAVYEIIRQEFRGSNGVMEASDISVSNTIATDQYLSLDGGHVATTDEINEVLTIGEPNLKPTPEAPVATKQLELFSKARPTITESDGAKHSMAYIDDMAQSAYWQRAVAAVVGNPADLNTLQVFVRSASDHTIVRPTAPGAVAIPGFYTGSDPTVYGNVTGIKLEDLISNGVTPTALVKAGNNSTRLPDGDLNGVLTSSGTQYNISQVTGVNKVVEGVYLKDTVGNYGRVTAVSAVDPTFTAIQVPEGQLPSYPLPSYYTYDATAGWQFSEDINVPTTSDNLITDTTYEWTGYHLPLYEPVVYSGGYYVMGNVRWTAHHQNQILYPSLNGRAWDYLDNTDVPEVLDVVVPSFIGTALAAQLFDFDRVYNIIYPSNATAAPPNAVGGYGQLLLHTNGIAEVYVNDNMRSWHVRIDITTNTATRWWLDYQKPDTGIPDGDLTNTTATVSTELYAKLATTTATKTALITTLYNTINGIITAISTETTRATNTEAGIEDRKADKFNVPSGYSYSITVASGGTGYAIGNGITIGGTPATVATVDVGGAVLSATKPDGTTSVTVTNGVIVATSGSGTGGVASVASTPITDRWNTVDVYNKGVNDRTALQNAITAEANTARAAEAAELLRATTAETSLDNRKADKFQNTSYSYTVSIANGGTGYAAADHITIGGEHADVSSVDDSGAITAAYKQNGQANITISNGPIVAISGVGTGGTGGITSSPSTTNTNLIDVFNKEVTDTNNLQAAIDEANHELAAVEAAALAAEASLETRKADKFSVPQSYSYNVSIGNGGSGYNVGDGVSVNGWAALVTAANAGQIGALAIPNGVAQITVVSGPIVAITGTGTGGTASISSVTAVSNEYNLEDVYNREQNDVATAGIAISLRAKKVLAAMAGNFAGLTSDGDLTDSGVKSADKVDTWLPLSGGTTDHTVGSWCHIYNEGDGGAIEYVIDNVEVGALCLNGKNPQMYTHSVDGNVVMEVLGKNDVDASEGAGAYVKNKDSSGEGGEGPSAPYHKLIDSVTFGELATIVQSLVMGGIKIGSFPTWSAVPQNVSGFTTGTPKVNDYITVQVDESQGNARTQYWISAIDGSGDITWEFDGAFNVAVEPTIYITDFTGNTFATFIPNDNVSHNIYWDVNTPHAPSAAIGLGSVQRYQDSIYIIGESNGFAYTGSVATDVPASPVWHTLATTDGVYIKPASGIPNNDLTQMANATFKGNVVGYPSTPQDLTIQQLRTAISEDYLDYVGATKTLSVTAFLADPAFNKYINSETKVMFNSLTINAPLGLTSDYTAIVRATGGNNFLIVALAQATGDTYVGITANATPNVLNWTTSTTANKVVKGAGGTYSVAGPQLQAFIDSLPRFLTSSVVINVTSSTTSAIVISGFNGLAPSTSDNISLTISANSAAGITIAGTCAIFNNVIQIRLNGINTTGQVHLRQNNSVVLEGTVACSVASLNILVSTCTVSASAMLTVAGATNVDAGSVLVVGASCTLVGAITTNNGGVIAWVGNGTIQPTSALGYQSLNICDFRSGLAMNRYAMAHKGWLALPVEYKTGEFFGGKPVYMREFKGNVTATTPCLGVNTTLISSGIDEIFDSGGWLQGGTYATKYFGSAVSVLAVINPIQPLAIGTLVVVTNALVLNSTARDARDGVNFSAYHYWAKYTKIADAAV
jgi:hypothetical protein